MTQIELQSVQINSREIREMLGLSVSEFAVRFGFHPLDIRKWESGDASPSGADRTLLIVIERIPDEVMDALSAC